MKNIQTFKQFNESTQENRFYYYVFDWDDNLLFLPTLIHMDKLVDGDWVPEDVSTSKFAKIRTDKNWRIRNNDPKEAFIEFGDKGDRGENAFYEDSINAIENRKFGPSWKNFIDCLVKGKLFAIITSRAHEPKSIRKVIEWVIYNYLSDNQQDQMITNLLDFHQIFGTKVDFVVDQYLKNCKFIGVGSNWFKTKFKDVGGVEDAKKVALQYFKNGILKFMRKVNGVMSLGFSDDDLNFVKSMRVFMKDEKKIDDINYYVFNTSNPSRIKITRI